MSAPDFSTLRLRLGAEGEDVRWVQEALGISVDGDFGRKTDTALRAWQAARGRKPDGVVGPATGSTMVAALAARPTTPAPAAIPAEAAPVQDGVITADLIHAGFPKAKDPERWAAALTAAWQRFPAFNRLGLATILAKANTEAKNLTRWDEDLHYTTVAQLVRMHGSRAGSDPASLLRRPVATGDQVYKAWGGYMGRGLGLVQLTTLANHQSFAKDFGMTLPAAREWMLTPEGAAMTPFCYLGRTRTTVSANRGNMNAVLAAVAGKFVARMDRIWDSILRRSADDRFRAVQDCSAVTPLPDASEFGVLPLGGTPWRQTMSRPRE